MKKEVLLVECGETDQELEDFQDLKVFIDRNIDKAADRLRDQAEEEGWDESVLYFVARESLVEEFQRKRRR